MHQAYGLYLAATGRFDESVAEMKRAQEMDPLTPASNMIGMPFYYARQYDEAIHQFRKALEMNLDFSNTRFRLGLHTLKRKCTKPQSPSSRERYIFPATAMRRGRSDTSTPKRVIRMKPKLC